MQAIADAKPLSDAELPARAPRGAPLGKEGALVADLLKLLLKIRSREIDIAARLLARSDDLEALAAGQRKGLQILEGWRFEQFGRDALELVEGKLAFAVVKNRLKMAHIDAIAGSGENTDAHLGEPDGSLSLGDDSEGDGRNWDDDEAPEADVPEAEVPEAEVPGVGADASDE
jgi:ribonuclease D